MSKLDKYKITREQFIHMKFKEIEKLMKKYLPKNMFKLKFENIWNQLKELIC